MSVESGENRGREDFIGPRLDQAGRSPHYRPENLDHITTVDTVPIGERVLVFNRQSKRWHKPYEATLLARVPSKQPENPTIVVARQNPETSQIDKIHLGGGTTVKLINPPFAKL